MIEMNSKSYEGQEEIERRLQFYNNLNAIKYLKKNGIPKSRRDMKELVELEYQNPDQDTVASVGFVYFQVHPQQINIRDKANGKLIVSIAK